MQVFIDRGAYLPSRFACLSTTVTAQMDAAVLYSAVPRSAGTAPVRRAAAMLSNVSAFGLPFFPR